MTVIELRSARLARPSLVDSVLLDLAAAASSLVERRIARRSASTTPVRSHDDAQRDARAGAHALGLLPR